MNARQAVTTSASKEHESPDGERFILRQPFAMAGTTVPTICQPAISPTERVALTGEDIDNFVSFSRAQYNKEIQETDFDLRSWVALETLKIEGKADAGPSRKLTVAFAIGKLLRHLKSSVSSYSQCEILHLCSIDNFLVQMVANGARDEGWEVSGIEMVSPSMAIQVMPTSFSGAIESVGNCIDAVVTRHSPFCCAKKSNQDERDCDSALCYALGVLVRFIFSDGSSLDSSSNSQENPQETQKQNYMNDFLRSLSISPSRVIMNTNDLSEPSRPTKLICDPSHYDQKSISVLGMPSLVAALVRDLLACQQENDILESRTLITLDAAIDDLHMLLTRPGQFLFGANQELPTVTNMYGRASESSALLDAFRRVTARGQSETFFVKGFSGSGKTRLVQCAVDAAVAARGLVVQKKFEVNSTNHLYLVLSAFNDLCEQLAKDYYGSAKEGTVNLWHQLVMEFGSNLHILANILPNIIRLTPSPAAAFSLDQGTKGDVNFFSLCDIIKRFMRVISATSLPVMMVLDDLQWGDSVSLGLVHAVLSDKKGASCLFFVGCYRDNELDQHHILHGFHNWLCTSDVPSSTIHLDGISQENVLSLISDSLGMLPRLCLSLSQVIYRKTEGNPLFVQTFLRSLVDKRMLTYSPRERVWVWEMDQIHDEGIAPNVLDLLSAKMAACSAGLRVALQVASCFGIRVDSLVVKALSGTSRYSNLAIDLNKAVDDGMMDLDPGGSNYKFVHDKVREAAYDMISTDDKDRFHFDVGMLLLSSFGDRTEEKSKILFYILNQINHGVPDLLQDEEQRVMIAKMNHEVASQMMHSYNYTAAYQYSERAVVLLPENCWSQSDDISIDVYFLLSKAAFSNGKIDRAMSALSKVIEHTNSNMGQLKLDAYKLKHDIILDSCIPGEMAALLNTILDVLASLGEDHRSTDNLCESTISAEFRSASEMFEIEINDALSHAYRVDSCDHKPVMEAYYIVSNLAYHVKPKLCPYFVTRWAIYTLRNKVMCKYTPAAYVSFATIMCKDRSSDDMELGHRIGKLGLRIMHEMSYESMLPTVYMSYYGYVGCLFEPLQAVIDMHQRAIDVSLNLGNSSIAALHEVFLIVRKKYAGVNLLEIKDVLERRMNMQNHPGSSAVLRMILHEDYEGVCTLIGETTSGLTQTFDGSSGAELRPHNMSRLMTCCYLGQYERAVHMAKQWETSHKKMPNTSVQFRRIYESFFYGLSCIGLRRQKGKNKRPNHYNSSDKLWLDVVEDAARCSKYNFGSKRALLIAEKLSYSCDNDAAEVMYGTAIKASKSSHFIHEEALSCELAGGHYERLGKVTKSLELYKRAESCYDIWGSMVKSNQMRAKINSLDPTSLK